MKTAVCLYARDEERDIAEWLAYQFAIGFDTAIVYDNGSIDRTAEIVRACGRQHDVRLVAWENTEKFSQIIAYTDCLDKFGSSFEWIAFIDADEFIVPAIDIPNLLSIDQPAIALNWKMFGSSGLVDRPPGLLVETFTRRAQDTFGPNRQMKSIVRPHCVTGAINPHEFKLHSGSYATVSGQMVRWLNPGCTIEPDYAGGCINHYFTKSLGEWNIKLKRGYRDGTLRDGIRAFEVYDHNEIEDREACRFSESIRRYVADDPARVSDCEPFLNCGV